MINKPNSDKKMLNGVDIIMFVNAVAFKSWLNDNYQRQDGVWIKIAKKSSGIPSITDDEAVDVGLCWGWISGQRLSLDQTYYLQKYVPRRSKSVWSQINVDKVEKLIATGQMQAPGLLEINTAKTDGRWDAAYVSQRNASPPADLIYALEQNKMASDFYAKLKKTEKYAIILSLVKERITKNRSARLEKMITTMAAGEMAK